MNQKIDIPYSVRMKVMRDRIAKAMRHPRFEGLKKSAKVLAAEKTVEAWEREHEAARSKFLEAYRKKVREIEDAVMLGDAERVVHLLNEIGA